MCGSLASPFGLMGSKKGRSLISPAAAAINAVTGSKKKPEPQVGA